MTLKAISGTWANGKFDHMRVIYRTYLEGGCKDKTTWAPPEGVQVQKCQGGMSEGPRSTYTLVQVGKDGISKYLPDFRHPSECDHAYAFVDKNRVRHASNTGVIESKTSDNGSQGEPPPDQDCGARWNPCGLQMLSDGIYRHLFPDGSHESACDTELIKTELQTHGLWGRPRTAAPQIQFTLPKLQGTDLDSHFRSIAMSQSEPYVQLINLLISSEPLPVPSEWVLTAGWMKYAPGDPPKPVPYPEEDCFVLDVEVIQNNNVAKVPTLAAALSPSAWYLWCSQDLVSKNIDPGQSRRNISDLIPLETVAGKVKSKGDWKPKVVIAHNAAFDRSYVKEQYLVRGTKLRFVDTMSMHMAVSGVTSFQRNLLMAAKAQNNGAEEAEEDGEIEVSSNNGGGKLERWQPLTSLSNLSDVHQLYCGGPPLDKAPRDVFISGTLGDVRAMFQDLCNYCASDVLATYKVSAKLFPLFQEHFPHPVTFAGFLEMGNSYLPVNSNWDRYIRDAEDTYNDLQQELKLSLMQQADEACALLHDDRYKDDLFLHDLDWSVKDVRWKKTPQKKQANEDKIQQLYDSRSMLHKKMPHMCGYPKWYCDLCPLPHKIDEEAEDLAGPSLISSSMQLVPKLLRLTWNGHPLHYHPVYRWGYLVPTLDTDGNIIPPLWQHWIEKLPTLVKDALDDEKVISMLEELKLKAHLMVEDKQEYIRMLRQVMKKRKSERMPKRKEYGPHVDKHVPNGFEFWCLPHKDGPGHPVGNPLSKDFLHKVEDGTIQTAGVGPAAGRILKGSQTVWYWRNNRDRIMGQQVVYLERNQLPSWVANDAQCDDSFDYGAIVPQVVPAGTLTRRAVEPTWLTASNASEHRLGSELKAMVQAPPGCHLVGADVDSQELWIASLLGDCEFMQEHGCTALGWMTVQGKKEDGSDMHSWTAKEAGVSRHQAKVLNYGRIYGAGKSYATQLLMQFNLSLTAEEAKKKAEHTYRVTKGERKGRSVWKGGTESHMFNRLEKIACAKIPCTPFLGARISRALQPSVVGNKFMTSRVNWVVQSSAVDYLHLMLVCMKWLIESYGIESRFCLSLHDEVRYLVRNSDRYRAALALQVTNLMTRAFCVNSVGMRDLPQSIAFFSAVDIDKVMRKEVNLDCKSPSNPHGLEKGYNIQPGVALDIYELLNITNGSLQKPKAMQKS